jgi:hypothetical protein
MLEIRTILVFAQIMQKALLLCATHKDFRDGVISKQALGKQPIRITGVFMDPVYAMDGRERNHSGNTCLCEYFCLKIVKIPCAHELLSELMSS